MTPNSPRSQERDNQNSLRKYPFSDAAECGNGSCVILPGAIVDARLYVPGRDSAAVWLSEIDESGKLHFSDEDGEFAVAAYAAQASTAVPVTFTGDGGPLPGGVVAFGGKPAVSALLSYGGATFTRAQGELAPNAVVHLGLPGVTGFLLDDGNVVSGKVRFRGSNGAAVSTLVKDGICYLRISAIGRDVTEETTTGFITTVEAESDNTNFVVAPDSVATSEARPNRVINVMATGASTVQDDDLSADQETTCSSVRKRVGSVPSSRAGGSTDCICDTDSAVTRRITLTGGTTRQSPATFSWTVGTALGSVTPPTLYGKRFAGYFDASSGGRQYYRSDGSGVGAFSADADVTLYAHWIDEKSAAVATFDGYGTLHLAAPSTAEYSNPVEISGEESPVPVVTEVSDDVLEAGGADALAELVLHPSVPSGEVTIGLRGLGKAYST